MSSKAFLRLSFLKIRRSLSVERREEAKKNLLVFLQARLTSFSKVLSFASTKEEIDLGPLNRWLLEEGKLLLPKIQGNELAAYLVNDLSEDLAHNFSFPIQEPKEHCPLVKLTSSDCILVPGLAFDSAQHRLGYGQGFYDRLLIKSPAFSIGVGFKEQFSSAPLPTEPQDQKIKELALF